MSALTGKEKPALSFLPESALQVVESPDRTRVAYTLKHDDHRDIRVANADGANDVQVTEGLLVRSVAWSPKGDELAFDVGGIIGETTYVVPAAGGSEPQAVYPGMGSYPSWSPDGTRIVVVGMHAVQVINRDGSGDHRLHISQADRSQLDWSPDGKLLAYTGVFGRQFAIATVDADTGETAQLTPGYADAGFARWSPDGKCIAYEATAAGDPSSNIHIVDVASRRVRTLTSCSDSHWDARLAAGGRRMLYSTNEISGGLALCCATAAGRSPYLMLPFKPNQAVQTSWPKDAASAALTSVRDILFASPFESPRKVIHTDHPTWAELAPTGDVLAYVQWIEHQSSIVVRDLRTGLEREVLASPGPGMAYSRLSWSPDGERIALVCGEEIRVAPRRGGSVIRAWAPNAGQTGNVVLQPLWSPDSQWIAFGSFRRDSGQLLSVHIASADGGDSSVVAECEVRAEPGSYSDVLNQPCAWSPDGSALALCLEADGAPGLYTIAVHNGRADGAPVLLREKAAYPSWYGDGKAILATALNGNRERLCRVSASDGATTLIRAGRVKVLPQAAEDAQ